MRPLFRLPSSLGDLAVLPERAARNGAPTIYQVDLTRFENPGASSFALTFSQFHRRH